uniref:Uncharacterized protein n=1 Tax=Photinus pyralis TaxID=7054 RepID=A0A1Y1K6E3_PHOPY
MDDHSHYKQKSANPRENANPVSIFTLFYIIPTFFYGYRKTINEDDIYETLPAHKSCNLGTNAIESWNEEVCRATKLKVTPSLRKVIIKLLFREYLVCSCYAVVCELIAKPLQAYFLGELILSYSDKAEQKEKPYVYALGIVVCIFTFSFLVHPLLLESYHISLKVRVICSSLIYRKVLRLSKRALEQTTAGQILNLISNDVNVFDKIVFTSQYLWIAPIQTIIVLTLMYKEIGVSSFPGVFLLICFIPLYIALGRMTTKYRLKSSVERDHRLRFMNEAIQGINVIKMYAWEGAFSKIVIGIRKLEIYFIKLGLYIRTVYLAYGLFTTIAIFASITSVVLLDQSLDAKTVFMTMSLLYLSSGTLNFILPQGLIFLSEIVVSINRITQFLLCDETTTVAISPRTDLAISIRNGSSAQSILSNLNLEIKSGGLTAIIGSVGSGKTSLLNLILGEIPLSTGEIQLTGNVSFAPQEPWIFSATIRQNVLFGAEWCETRYKDVIRCCALERDLKLFPYGDQTIVGEKGTSLSGGQKARISLARTVYRDTDVYLLDDPLSAVDAQVGQHIFGKCIKTFLKGKTIVLVTHQLHYLKRVEDIVVLDKGQIIAKGTRSMLEKSGFDFSQYLQQNTEGDGEYFKSEDFHATIIQKTAMKTGSTAGQTTGTKFISAETYRDYFCASKSHTVLIMAVLSFILTQFTISGSNYFLAYWVNMENENSKNKDTRLVYICTYATIVMACLLCTIARSVYFVKLVTTSSKVLHNKMFANVVNATIRFFGTNSSGIILNRFAKDLGTIDELLPNAILVAARTTLSILGVFCVICFVNPLFLIPTLVMVVILFYIRSFYLTTNLNILRVEGRVRGPLYGHVNASLQGLSTIRAFKNQETLTNEFYHHQDTHSAALEMALVTSRAFAYWLDLLCALYITLLTTYYIFYADAHNGNVGLIISQALQLMAQLPWGVRQITDVENFMVCVERVLEYDTIEKEQREDTEGKEFPSSWPTFGKIELKGVYLKYSHDDPYALKNLSFVIRPLEKVGIVGRTGAGKSSIIAALFQLVETEGSILIDEFDIKNLKLHDLRTKMSIIPQEPVLFSGTVRYNIDPFNEYDDRTIWKALEEVRLKELVAGLSAGLHFEISPDTANFSVGQRQLICLARAIVRNNKILLLDEATANVDLKTDEIIQETIRTKFSCCTVITIAHRLNTVIDSDKILVLDSGVAVEFDHPYVLLQNKDGAFYNLVQQTEKVMADALFDLARKNYSKSPINSNGEG